MANIEEVDVNIGYDSSSLADSASYFELLPKEAQRSAFRKTLNENDDEEIKFDSFLNEIKKFRKNRFNN